METELLEIAGHPLHELEVQLCLSQLRTSNAMYIRRVEVKQAEMRIHRALERHSTDDFERRMARRDWRQAREDIIHIYKQWLDELRGMIISADRRSLSLHQMMVANCHWFLATTASSIRSPPSSSSSSLWSSTSVNHHFSAAIASYDRIFSLLADELPSFNEFYLFLVSQYSRLAVDSRDRRARVNAICHAQRMRIALASNDQYLPKAIRRRADEIETLVARFSAI